MPSKQCAGYHAVLRKTAFVVSQWIRPCGHGVDCKKCLCNSGKPIIARTKKCLESVNDLLNASSAGAVFIESNDTGVPHAVFVFSTSSLIVDGALNTSQEVNGT